MRGYLKSIQYWAYFMEMLFFSMLGTVVLVFAIYAFIDAGGTSWYRWVVNYFPMMGIIFPVAGGMNLANMQVPLALSSGSTRKETAFGVLVMTHIVMLQLWIFGVIGNALLPEIYHSDEYARVCGLLFLISCGIGIGLGAAILRFGGKVGMVIYIFMIILVVMSIGIVSALSGFDAVFPLINSAGMLVAGVVFDVIMTIVFYLAIRNYEVRI